MKDGDTNPNMVSLGRVYTAVKDMRTENREEHKAITCELVAQGKQITCLSAKWETFWKMVKIMAPSVLAIAGAVFAVMKLI